VPVVPTHLVRRGEATRLADVMGEHGWPDVVVKPAISAGSRNTLRIEHEMDRGEAHLRVLAREGDVLVQPYLASVEGYGERSLVWIDGELTHAVRKSRRFLGDPESVSAALPIAPEEAELARRALAAVPAAMTPLLYARVDTARDSDGQPCLMELELVEPSLFFPQSPAALDRYVRAVQRQLDR
jgi:glutathione synthase/RimK-type ligase-like ATP-grasp enzyme